MSLIRNLKRNYPQDWHKKVQQFSYGAIATLSIALIAPQSVFAQASEVNYQEWLGIYGAIFQKLAFLLLTAYFFIKTKPFYRVVTHSMDQSSRKDLWTTAGILTLLGAFTCSIDFLRSGEADWAFMDLQLVFTSIAGLLGGVFLGLLVGIVGFLVKFALSHNWWPYGLILVGGGILGGVIFHIKSLGFFSRRSSLICGGVTGALHGLLTYQPLVGQVPFSIVMLGILVLTALETLCLYAFVAFTLGFLGDQRRKRLEKLLPEMKLKFLQAQINPHFLFNALNSIAAICTREKAEGARELVVKLSNYFRRIVKREDEWVSLQEELEHIQNYLEIEKARYQTALQIKIDYQLSPKGAYTQIPILIIQPLVENAIKYGIAAKSGGGTLEISAREIGKMVEIIIKDDGVGISDENLRLLDLNASQQVSRDGKNDGAGIGLQNIKERLKYQFGANFKFYIESKEGVGTAIHLQLPIEHEREE